MTPNHEVRVISLLERIVALLESLAGQGQTVARPCAPVAAEEPQVPAEPEPTGAAILARLKTLGVQVNRTGIANPLDAALLDTARFIGERYAEVRDLMTRIKCAIPHHGTFNLDLKGRPPETVNANFDLAGELYRIAFLENYQYQKPPRASINARPSSLPAAQQFFTGRWFEMYCRDRLKTLLRESGWEEGAEILHNVQGRLPDGEEFEFDLLLMVGGELFWLEQKSGSYQRHLERYARLTDSLALDEDHAFLVLLQAGEKTAQVLGDLCGMTVCDVGSLPTVFGAALAGLDARIREPADEAEPLEAEAEAALEFVVETATGDTGEPL